MSIYFDFDVGPTGRRFRRATDIDRFDIELFWEREHTDLLFGEIDLGSLIELSTLSICMINENKEVVGFMALCDHPSLRSVEPSDWETWIRNLYQKFYLSRNTLFIHFMCCTDSVKEFFVEEALVSVFMNDFYLLNIVLVAPVFCPDGIIKRLLRFKRGNIIQKVLPKSEERNGNCLYTAMRQEFCPKLRMRRAVEEDNDDIVKILDKQCTRLKQLYGEYYESEIIGRHPESNRKIIVADSGSRAVGVMCLNTDINYKKLQKLYELRPYYGLRKATALEKEHIRRANDLHTSFGEPILLGKWSPFDNLNPKFGSVADDEPQKDFLDTPRTKKISKVNFKRKTAMRRSLDHIIYKTQHSDDFSDKVDMPSATPSQATVPSVINLLDEDPFDYEIVNIDSNLLSLPEGVSFDLMAKPSFDQPKQSQISLNASGKCRRDKKRQTRLKTSNIDETEPVIYRGGKNAFIIELFALRSDIDDRCCFDFLEAIFEAMKDYDYCLIRVPAADKTFPLLQHFCFVPTRPRVCSKYSLYLAHTSSVSGKMRVREMEFKDIPQIAGMLQNLDARETMWTVQNGINKTNQAYVLSSGTSLIGLGILESPEQIEFIRSRFNLDSYHIHKYHHRSQGIDAGFATLKLALVYPVFEPHYRFFVQDMMRLSGSSGLLWLTAYRNKWAVHKANCLVTAMVPLIPRPFFVDCSVMAELKKTEVLSNNIMAFSTWFISKKITSISKADVGTRIVIVGASKTALGFLNALLFDKASSYLTFTNVTLISPNGLPYMRHTKSDAELMFPRCYTTCNKYLKSVPYTYYVNVVQGTMMEIDQKNKVLLLTSEGKYHYDLLFLFFGKQYQHPNYMSHLLEQEKEYQQGRIPQYIRLDVPRRSDTEIKISSDVTPENVFIINDITEANRALYYVKNLWDFEFNIIVYGSTIEAYCCLNALIESDIPPENIVFVEPFPSENPNKLRVPVFCNTDVDQTVLNVLDTLKVKVYRSYYFESWLVASDDNIVTHVDFLSHFHMLRLECAALFYYGKRGVDTQAFVAVNKSNLTYDGGIVIDLECRTSDPSIYAAGPTTRYNKKFFVPSHRHKYYDSYEVGEKLGAQIRNKLDPLFTEKPPPTPQTSETSTSSDSSTSSSSKSKTSKDETSDTTDSLSSSDRESRPNNMRLMDLTKPRVTYCTLPGNLRYLEVRAPGMKTPNHYVQSLQFNGIVMETFKCGYFKLHLTRDHVVDGVTCLSPEAFSLENFQHLYGKPGTVLNNVHLRYTANKLNDFYEFFRLPWAYFLYHDHADDLFTMAKELLPKPKGRVLKDALHEIGDKLSNPEMRLNTKLRVRANFEKSAHVGAINAFVVDWLSQNDILLPMYLQPWQVNLFSHDQAKNPMFMAKTKKTIKNMLRKLL